MTYSHRNIASEQKEAYQKVQQLTAICETLSLTIDPVDWQNAGIRALVTVNAIKISDLLDLGHQDSASLLRRFQLKLLEHAALEAIHARPELKVLIWSPVDVVQPQAFLSLWILTLETDERVGIAEYIRDGKRVYEHYELDVDNGQQLAQLFGPVHTGKYQCGDMVTIEEHERKYIGEIVYILSPGKVLAGRKYPPGGSHATVGKVSPNDVSSRYLLDCHDGFPHIVNQWQIVNTPLDNGEAL